MLVDYGFTIEIDDFGSGYSSLNTLKDVPAQILKLDMKFFEDNGNVERGGNIIESVIRMAKWLGMAVIAEGVEEEAQADFLKTIGCYYIQGYFYSKPITLANFEALIIKEQREPKLDRLITVKELDNNRFWDPKSMDTLIFNSYIGGACLFEFFNNKTELIRANDRYFEIFKDLIPAGSSLKDYTLKKFVSDKDRESIIKLIKHCIEIRTEVFGEFKLAKNEDVQKYVRMTIRTIAEAGDRYLFYCVIENITAQKIAQLEKEELEKKKQEISQWLQVIINNSPNGIVATLPHSDGSIEFVFANQTFFDLLGYTAEQFKLEVNNIAYCIAPESREMLVPKLINLKEEGQSIRTEIKIIKRDGSFIWLRGTILVISLQGITVPVQLANFTDITTEIITEQNLRFLNESSHEIIKIHDCNQALAKTLEKLLFFLDAQRAYIVELEDDLNLYKKVHEVCAEGITPRSEAVKAASIMDIKYLFSLKNDERLLYITDIEKLENEKAIRNMKALGINSFVVSFLWQRGKLTGITFIENPQKTLSHIDNLSPMCDYISILIARRDAQEIEEKLLPITLSQIMSNSQDMIYVKDLNLRYIAASPAAYHLAGCSNEQEIIGKTDEELFQRDLSDKYAVDDQKVLDEGHPVLNDQDLIVTENGEIHSVFSSKYPLRNSNNKIIGVYGISRDMTKAAETESRLKLLTDAIPGGLISIDCKEGDFKVVYTNENFIKTSGYTQEELQTALKEDPLALLHEENIPVIKDFIQKHFDRIINNEVLRCDCKCKTKYNGYQDSSLRCSVHYISVKHFILNAVIIKKD